jgi:type IV fimbrial biogenesis protein FimT
VVVLAVAAILVTVGIPALQELVRNGRLVTAANDLIADISLARSEAVKRRGQVVVCATADPGATAPVCGNAQDWGRGHVVFVDADGDGKAAPADVLRVAGGPGVGIALRANSGLLRFRPDGSLIPGPEVLCGGGTGALFAPVCLGLCDSRGTSAGRQVLVSAVGRAEVRRGDPSRSFQINCTP